MSKIMALSLGVGIPCFIWSLMASLLGWTIWTGFVGCTSYFTAGGGKKGLLKALVSNYTGILWATFAIAFSSTNIMQGTGKEVIFLGALSTGIISWGMTYQAKFDIFGVIPCTFMACFSTFANNGDWKSMLIGVTFGNILGGACSLLANFFTKFFVRKDDNSI